MYYQYEYIRERVSLTRNDTWKLDLPDHGTLSSLFLRIDARVETGNPMGSIRDWRLIDYLDSITVLLNGATVAKKLSGKQIQFLAMLDQKVMPPQRDFEYSQPYVSTFLLLNFGRFLGDTDMGLDLGRFNSVELQIKNTCSTSYFQDDMYASVLAYWMRDMPGGVMGFMRSEEWRKWTTVADERVYLDLPTAYPLRRIVLQATPDEDGTTGADETLMANVAYDIELFLKTGMVRVYKGGIDDILRLNVFDTHMLPQYCGETYHAADKGFNLGVGRCHVLVGAIGKQAAGAATSIACPHDHTGKGTGQMRAYTADQTFQFMAIGQGFHNCVVFPFDHNPNPIYWLDPETNKVVQLNIHTRNASSAADGEIAVVLDQLVRY